MLPLPSLLLATVAILAPTATKEELAAAVAGCNQVLTDSPCFAGAGTDPGGWQALITWQEDGAAARLELSRTLPDAPTQTLIQEVGFASTDPPEQRYQALGVIIAARVLARAESRASTPNPAERTHPSAIAAAKPESQNAPTPSSKPRTTAEPAAPPPRAGLDAGLLLSPSLEQTPLPAWGIGLRGFTGLGATPGLFLVQGRWLHAENQLTQNDFSASAGLGLRLAPPRSPLSFDVRLELTGELVWLSATKQGQVQEALRWRGGGRLGLDMVIACGRDWGIFVGGDVGLLVPRLVVEVSDQELGRTDQLQFQGLLGARWLLPGPSRVAAPSGVR